MNNQNDIDKELEKLLNDTESEVVKAYVRTLNDLRLKIAELFEKYAKGDELSYQDAMKYNRLEALIREITTILNNLYGINLQLVQTAQTQQFESAYYLTFYVLEQGLQQNLSFTLLNPETIEAAINNPITGLTLNQRLEKNRIDILYKLRQEITQGLIQGEGYAKIANRIVDAVGKDRRKALTIARTEGGRAHSLGKLAAYEETQRLLSNTEKMWVSTLDAVTRPSHRTLDGKRADEEGYFHYGGEKAAAPRLFGKPQLDINCRCSFIIIVDGIEPTVRRARKDDGKNEVIPYQTYEDWYKSKTKDE